MSDKILPVIIGGLITLIGTLAVQIFVIPRVQVHSRRRERWEKDAIELAAVIEDELPRVLDGYRTACLGPWILRRRRNEPGFSKQSVEELDDRWQTERREADKAVGETLARVNALERRIRRIRPKAPYWRSLDQRHQALRFTLFNVDLWWLDEDAVPDDETWETGWKAIAIARERLLDTVLEVADRPKPPPRRLIFRLRSAAPEKLRKTVSYIRHPSKWFEKKPEQFDNGSRPG